MNLYNVLSNRYVGMSNFERLFAQKFGGTGGKIEKLEGIPPLTFTANGQPLLDYLISGNTVQTGTPTPESPIMPEGVGERTENVMPAGEQKTVVSNGVTFSSDGNGRYHISGTPTAAAAAQFNLLSAFTTPISVSNGGQGTLSFFNAQSNSKVTLRFYNGTTIVDGWIMTPINRTNTAYSGVGNKYIDSIAITISSGETVDMTIMPEFTNNGVLPSEFEPYGYKLPILSNSTVTNIYLGEAQTTRRIKKLVLTGEENWVIISSRLCILKPTNCTQYSWSVSTHFIQAQGAAKPGEMYIGGSYINFNYDGVNNNIPDFKSYLAAQYAAGTPVTVWYVLAEPTTGILNEPLMKLGDYADTVSMEQAGVSIPTNKGSTTLDVDTTIKPSNVYIKYKS